ncbi:uncharacterized protein LOC128551050 [Mercenaria mercenaria]|uniref:uncharacterized protein LOC128551050 n=1 Tax=Mercenaria mercenaria TaxID=6596 RepID=UPI00234F88CA|nr:uncharacterized protein LOC128551050 [Mercenaria mercenaria]
MYCYAGKDTVNSCSLNAPYRSVSSHMYDLSIACTPCGLPDIYNGDPVAFNGTELTVTCHTGFYPNQIKMKCQNNNSWYEEQRCTPLHAFPLNISDIQLKNSYRPSEGRVEILVNGTWGTICDTDFASADATVICKMFGLEYSSFYTKAKHYGRGSGPIYVDKLNCTGTESHINLCSYEISNNCTHYDDVAVICTGYQLEITDIRLAGTNGPYHGRVELKVNGTWGTVCDDYFYSDGARAVCKLFGLTYQRYIRGAYYGQGSGPIFVDRLDCPYTTNTDYPLLNDCAYAVDNYYNCGHNEDVSVMCYGPILNITAARLVNGTGQYDGRAEINVNGTWGTICDENFNIQAADLFCGLMELRAAQYFTGAIYGEGSGPVFIDQLFCDDNDYSLSNCKYLFLNECTHERDISVVCNDCGQPDIYFWGVDFFTYNGTTLFADCSYYRTYVGKLKLTCDNQTQTWNTEGECQEYRFPLDVTDIRMADGPSSTNGRVELKSLDTWGTVCDDYFGMQEANAICSMLEYPPAVSYFVGAHYGPGTGPIFVDDLSCGGDALHINNCTYITYDNCDHDDDVSVVCTDCGDPKPEHGFINSTFTNYGSAVHVTCEKDFNLIGDFEIICQLNGTWSNLPICKLIDCGTPRPSNGNINTTSTTNATVAMVWCDDGYTLIGDSVITCQSNETWTNYPVCQIIDCSDPEPDFADVTLLGNKTTFGETAVISCWTGYTPTTNTLVSCLANGTWEEWPDCEIVDCDNPVPQKGSANSSDTTYNTILEITCGVGYNITGDSIIRCQADGTWSDYPRCDTSDCGQFSVANGEVNTSLGTTTGSSATVVCDEGYDIQGSSVVICSSTGWNESVTCQVQVCPDPTPENGNVSDTDSIDEFVFGNYASIECDTGYKIDGDNVITCDNGGVWSNRPTCKLIDCGVLTAPINGNIDDSQGTKYSAKITFTCNEDFLLVGDKTSICGDNGKWNNQPPTCAAKSEVGGPCISQEYCLMEDSLCIDSVCACMTGIYDIRTKKCDKMPLLPYGYGEGDYYIQETEVCGPTIFFPPGMPVSGKICTNLYVCSYGFVSFDYQYTNPTPPKNKDSVLTIGQNTIIAPFYGPIDKKTSGPVYYRSYDILNSYNRMKDDADLISYVENIVVKFGDQNSYEASFILIATWHETKALGIGFDTSKTSTFQAVLVSDGKSTYVFYIYGHGLMQWVDNDSNDTPVWVGVQVDTDDSLSSFTHPYAFTSQVLQLDLQPDVPNSEDDVAGLVFRPLHQQSVVNDAVDCIRWYNENYEDKKHLDYIASLTPECPCDIWLSRFDPWFWKIGLHRWRKDISHYCVDMLHAGNFGKYGKSCCYDLRTWLWEYERPLAGGFQLYHPRYPLDHIVNDVIPKTKCCVKSNYCNLYYELRPTGSCYISSSYDFGTFWGDPHFITLDRMNFTFNGLGEYTLLRVRTNNLTFDLQARTERAIKQDGNVSDATVFSAFAVKDSSNASIHVEINKAKTGMILYGNNVDLTKQFYNSTDPENPFVYSPEDPTEGRYIISKRDETVSVVFTTSGISLNISVNVGMLSLNTGVPKGLKGLTSGLLGNYDGNPDNDFTMPNGTVLRANLTEREVFEYGKTYFDECAFGTDKCEQRCTNNIGCPFVPA